MTTLAEPEADLRPERDTPGGATPGSLPHVRALDGVRGLAVAVVVAFHLAPDAVPGGFLGVSVFFTLSGFLITNLLLDEGRRARAVDLGRFWLRRARRLLPALVLGLALALLVAAATADTDQLRALPGDVGSSLLYVTNWRFVLAGDTYAAGYQEPSMVQHLWSLAIEEQFYVLFPLLAWALVRRGATRRTWIVVLALLMAGSMAATIVLGAAGDDARVYFGTDTRAFEILAGSMLAVLIGPTLPGRVRRLGAGRHALGLVPLLALVGLCLTVSTETGWLYRGGLWIVALCSVGLLLAALDDGPVARALAWAPLAGLGLVSYGVYLYHWPLALWFGPGQTDLPAPLAGVLVVAATLAVSLASYRLVEQPIRRRTVQPKPAVVAVALPGVAVLLLTASLQLSLDADDRSIADASDLVVSGSTTTTAPPTTVAPLPPVQRVLFVGDSLVHQSFAGVQAFFAERGIATEAVGGPGQDLLGERDAWLASLDEAVARFDPDVVVLESCCGHGDPRTDGDHYQAPDGRAIPLDSDELYAEWRSVALAATDRAAARGAQVLWVLAPPAQTNGYYGPIEGRIARTNDVYLSLAACRPGLAFADWRGIAAPDGSYAATLPDSSGAAVKVRADDGLHFTPEGVGLLSQLTYDAAMARWTSAGGRTAPATPAPC